MHRNESQTSIAPGGDGQSTNTTPGRLARLYVNRRLYRGRVERHVGWVRLRDGVRLTHHLDGYTMVPVGDRDFPARSVRRIEWESAA